jgi:antitoxin FitA
MAQLVVRNLEESVKRRLKQRAVKNGRSLEGEVREILKLSVKVERGAKSGAAEMRLGTQCDMTRLSP